MRNTVQHKIEPHIFITTSHEMNRPQACIYTNAPNVSQNHFGLSILNGEFWLMVFIVLAEITFFFLWIRVFSASWLYLIVYAIYHIKFVEPVRLYLDDIDY